ncbi:MAG: hypothetical protein IJT91_04580 [Clostridia bacterium]|nr:hypothetical protein [Clostridia bacterium]
MKKKNYQTDVALMSVTTTEFRAVTHFHDWKAKTFAGDDQIYDVAEFERDGIKRSIVHAKTSEMGMTAAAATAMKMIFLFRPRYLIMVGIAAGVVKEELEDQRYGDVIVPDVIWNYSAGKFVSQEQAEIRYGNMGFLPRSTAEYIPEDILPYLRKAASSDENPCHVYIGPMACGSTVVANRELLEKADIHAVSAHGGAGYGILCSGIRRQPRRRSKTYAHYRKKRMRFCGQRKIG